MDLILDTCGLLSLAGFADRPLSRDCLDSIRTTAYVHVSSCSLLEIVLKHRRGRLTLLPYRRPLDFWQAALEHYALTEAPVESRDFAAAVDLPEHHADPFDRIIIAQARRLRCRVVTYDEAFEGYDVRRIH